jgi:NAD(P)-dependent dehydrogenase (short-subunit alcohol dehydrogenase family)
MTYQLRDINGSVVVLTGATAGMGAATARELVHLGAKVVLNARNETRLEELVLELGPENAIFVAGDCSDPETSRLIAQMAIQTFGTIDAVVANAGIGMYGSILDYGDDEVNRMMRTNFEGTVHVIRATLPSMIEKGQGDVIIVSSVAGFRSGADEAIYAGTKHAQVGLAGVWTVNFVRRACGLPSYVLQELKPNLLLARVAPLVIRHCQITFVQKMLLSRSSRFCVSHEAFELIYGRSGR